MSTNGWIGVDLDGTLARYDGWKGSTHIGEPVPLMLARVKDWLSQGMEVRIFTARISGMAYPPFHGDMKAFEAGIARANDARDAHKAIEAWCEQHIGRVLPITNVKDYAMVELWDDRAVQVEQNTGRVMGRSTRGLV